jgi:hypothetical protein
MTLATSDISQQVRLITQANLEHSVGADEILEKLAEIRQVADRNAVGVNATLVETTNLRSEAEEIAAQLNGGAGGAAAAKKRTRSRRGTSNPNVTVTPEKNGEEVDSSD